MSGMSSDVPGGGTPRGNTTSSSAGTTGYTTGATEPTAERRVRLAYEAFNERDLDMLAEQHAEDTETISEPSGERFVGRDGVKRYMQRWLTAFPDGKVTITNIVAAGDTVVVEYRGKGRHTGVLATPSGSIQATGRTAEVPFCEVNELANGRIRRVRSYYDSATLARQLGIGG